jgi:hypothetical protein
MKIGIISDTHDSSNVYNAVELFNNQKVGHVFHAGDIVSSDTAVAFAGLHQAEFSAVFGNCAYDKFGVKRAVEYFGGKIYDQICDIELEGRKIFMKHIPDCIQQIEESGKYDLIIYGHTHKQDIHRAGKTLVVNPGTLRSWSFTRKSVVLVDLDDMNCEVFKLR